MKKIKISKSKIAPFDKNSLEVTWSPDGSQLLVSGETVLGIIKRNEKWDLSYSTTIVHKNPISVITWINESILATASLDKSIKIWNFKTNSLIYQAQT